MANSISSLIKQNWIVWKNGVKEARIELPFFWFLTLVLLFVMVGTLIYIPISSFLGLIIFVFLMVLHILMYWATFIIDFQNKLSFLIYLGLQLLLIIPILLIIPSIFMVAALVMTLMGQITGFPIPGKRKMISITFLIMFIFLCIWQINPDFFIQPALATLGILLVLTFQFIFTSVYNRTATAKYEALEALEKLEIANMKIEQMTRSEERQRIARELHDTLAQGLTGIILQLDAVDHYLEKGEPAKAQSVVQRSMQAARATLAESRQAIDNLRITKSHSTLEQRLREMRCDSKTDIQFICELPSDLNNTESSLIEKLIGEAITNICKHAHAKNAQISITHTPLEIQILAKDDGVGFDPQALSQQSGHYGLLGMQERVQSVKGSMQIQSQPSSGCKLTIHLPRLKDIANE